MAQNNERKVWETAHVDKGSHGFQIQPGTRWEPGLTDAEIDGFEREMSFSFAPIYRLYLSHMNIMPIVSHRFLVIDGCDSNTVLSMKGTDVIAYASSLRNFLYNDIFNNHQHDTSTSKLRVPFLDRFLTPMCLTMNAANPTNVRGSISRATFTRKP
jgi:hypothetical protein